MGDGRTYNYVVAYRAVQTSDMTPTGDRAALRLLRRHLAGIINEVRGINRVTTFRPSRRRRSVGMIAQWKLLELIVFPPQARINADFLPACHCSGGMPEQPDACRYALNGVRGIHSTPSCRRVIKVR